MKIGVRTVLCVLFSLCIALGAGPSAAAAGDADPPHKIARVFRLYTESMKRLFDIIRG